MKNMLLNLEEEDTKLYSKEITITCIHDMNEYYVGEKALISCLAKNNGNIMLEQLNVCIQGQCFDFDLGISQEKELKFEIITTIDSDFSVSAKNSEVSKTVFLPIGLLDKPKIVIIDLKSPKTVTYNEDFSIHFTLKKESHSNPKKITISLEPSISKKWSIKKLSTNQGFDLKLQGKYLKPGPNKIEINIQYEDERANIYNENTSVSVELTNVTLTQRMSIALRRFIGIFL